MKKRILPILLALIMALTLLPTLALADGTVEVAVDGDIQTAINGASVGATIKLLGSEYSLAQTLQLNKNVKLVGAENGTTITYEGRVVELSCSDVYLENITFVGDESSPVVRSSSTSDFDSFVVKNCTFKGGAYGLYLSEGVNNCAVDSMTLVNVNFTDNVNIGFYCGKPVVNGTISGGVVRGNGNGEGNVQKVGIQFFDYSPNGIAQNIKIDGVVFENNCGGQPQTYARSEIIISGSVASGSTLTVMSCKFENDADRYLIRSTNALVDASGNYWGEGATLDSVVAQINGNVQIENYYADSDMSNELPGFDGISVNNVAGLTYALDSASDGDTIILQPGDYDIGALRINKAVNLVGQDDVTLKGSIDYITNANNAEISISGLFFEADDTNTNHALNFSALKNSTINVNDCDFKGYQFGIGVNSQATGNTLSVSDSVFYEVNCAAGVKVGDAGNDVTFEGVETNGGFAVQAFGSASGESGYSVNAYYKDYISYNEDKEQGFINPDFNALETSATLVTPATFEDALSKATAGDTLILAPGEYDVSFLSGKYGGTPVNIIGSGSDKTTIKGAMWFGGVNGGKYEDLSITVKEVSFVNEDGLDNWSNAGLGFTQIYGCDITVENCVFDSWQFGVHMNGENTGTVLNFVNVYFKNTFVGISAQLDGAKIGKIAENVLTTENAFAVQAFTATEDYNYYTLADFNTARGDSIETGISNLDNSELAEGIAYENGGGMLRGYVLTNGDDVQAAINKLPDSGKSYIVLTPGSYDGFTVDKSLTILGANAGKNPNGEEGHGPLSTITGKVTINGYTDGTKPTVVFDGVAFTGEGRIWSQNGNGFCGINLTVQNCMAVNINDHFVYTTNPGTGDYRNGTIKIIDNYVSGVHNTAKTASAFNLWYAEEHIIMGNVVEDVDYNAFNLNDTVGDVTFMDNKISYVGQNGFQIANSAAEGADVVIGNNEFTNVAGNAIYFLGHSTDPAQIKSDISILNNRMNGCGGAIVFEKVSSVNAEAEDNFADGVPVGIVFKDSGDVNIANVNVLVDGVVVYASSGKVPYSIQLPAAPSKPGYIFMGWKCSDGHTHQANETVTVEKDMTFTAVWSNLPDIEPGEPDEPDVPDFPFTDVSVNAWYYEAVKYVYANGIMNGMDRYSFQPNGTLTRAMVWTMLARLDGVDTEGGNSWYAKAQEWATANSVSDGENPTGEVTREQLVTMLYRYAQYKGYDVSIGEDTNILSYVDVDQVSDWAMEAFQWACGTGVIEGDENSALTPKASTTRAQAAAMFMRFIEL